MSQKPVIAIDGPAASGKGTLARKLAENLNFSHMDTGALYRAVGYEVLNADGDPENESDALEGCSALSEKLKNSDPLSNSKLRTDEVGNAASKVAAIQPVRDALVTLQRNFAKKPADHYEGVIFDGRDIGTVICPNAPLKLYITAKTEIRAERRTKELHSKGLDVTYKAVLKDMRARDARDMERAIAPLRPADDAITIDSGDLSEAEMLQKALDHVKLVLNIS